MKYDGQSIQVQTIENDIVDIVFNAKKGSVNKFDAKTLKELENIINEVKADKKVKGLMIRSEKSTFIVGADITEFLEYFKMPEEKLESWIMDVHQIFNTIEDLSIPTVSAINGICLGGGCELTLSCDYRVMSSAAVIGLPETKLGIYPGWGGCVRLPRLIGADNAIEWIAGATTNKADAALKMGAVDSVVEPENLTKAALSILNDAIEGKLNWEKRKVAKKAPLMLDKIESTMCFEGSKGFIYAKTQGHYPAPLAALDAIEKGARLNRDEALAIEAKGFVKMSKTSVAENLVGIYLGDQYLKSKSKKLISKNEKISQAAVLGAGIMGGGVAYQSASKRVPIIMKDIRKEALELGMSEATKLLEKQIKRKKISTKVMAKILGSIKPTLNNADLSEAQVVVEAVVENEKIKASVLKETEGFISDKAVLASNTSTISITKLAEGLKRPENFCGMHFFNPVHLMPLVEVIRGEKSSDYAISQVVSYATSIGKTAIVVNDCAGFLVNRILFPYFFGFSKLLQDGADYKKVDKVMEKFGWPMGPAYLLDVVGIDTACHASKVMDEAYPDRMKLEKDNSQEILFSAKRYGQKNGKGFYKYEKDRRGKLKKIIDSDVVEFEKQWCTQEKKEFSDQEIIERMMLPMIIETARCLEDKIVETAVEADMGLIYGIGFPAFRGGALKYIDQTGMKNIIQMSDKYKSLGKLYHPTEKMIEMAEKNQTYYNGESK